MITAAQSHVPAAGRQFYTIGFNAQRSARFRRYAAQAPTPDCQAKPSPLKIYLNLNFDFHVAFAFA
jgi:hypothetical protein